MVVVGGSKSANTKELTRLCEINGTRALQIESAKELTDASKFAGVKRVGVTGGTSTPIEDLEAVARTVAELAGTESIKEKAAEIAHDALAVAATPQYRTTSLNSLDAR